MDWSAVSVWVVGVIVDLAEGRLAHPPTSCILAIAVLTYLLPKECRVLGRQTGSAKEHQGFSPLEERKSFQKV